MAGGRVGSADGILADGRVAGLDLSNKENGLTL
jgi:hypothetical protein